MEEKYISTGKAAKLAKKVSFATIKRMVYAGKLKAEKNPVGRWDVHESEVNRLHGVKPAGEPRGRPGACRVQGRLSRFGFDYLSRLAESYDASVAVVNGDVKKKDAMQELVEDTASIIRYSQRIRTA